MFYLVRPTLACAIASLILTGCASSNLRTPDSYQPEHEARIRVYWGATVKFYFDAACIPKKGAQPLVVSQPGLSALENKTIGMPVPPDADRYYHEYFVPADKPLTIRAQITKLGLFNGKRSIETTRPGFATFVPQRGQDYELRIDDAYGAARITARHLYATDTNPMTEPLELARSGVCED